ncbi:hypothetical protein JVU11DRAFT_538 [Chiua virens]|nr:hypothetical protein JVU11DRAFT_538 [Chiua virens]
MWKGEPGISTPHLPSPFLSPHSEYHLVAGGEELFLETALLPVKAEDSPDAPLLTPAGLFDEHSPASDRSAAPPPNSLIRSCTAFVRHDRMTTHVASASLPASDSHRSDPRRLSPLSSYSWTSDFARPPATQSCPNNLTPPSISPSTSRLTILPSRLISPVSPILPSYSPTLPSSLLSQLPVPSVSQTSPFGQRACPPSRFPSTPSYHPHSSSPSPPRLSSSESSSISLQSRYPRFQHYTASRALSHAPSGLLPPSGARLPFSRWLDSTSPTCIVQKIIVDEQLLAVIFYELDRGQCESMPSAKLIGIQKYHGRPERTPSPQSAYHTDSLLPTYTHMPGQCIPRSNLPQTSLSYALSAINADSSLSGTPPYSAAFMMPSLLS